MNEFLDDFSIETTESQKIPKKIFIIPYRDREQHKQLFITYMKTILEDEDYKMFFIHQNDKRPFNRGAIKNIGFLYCKQLYPHDYHNITLIFHDIDCMPWRKNLFDYDTVQGIVKHYYGFTFTLGGMFAIKGCDFEKINGFPNYWVWGFEDNLLQIRWLKHGGIDRTQFLHIRHPDILTVNHGNKRNTSKQNENRFISFDKKDTTNKYGISSIYNLSFNVDNIDTNIDMINVNNFTTEHIPNRDIHNEDMTTILKRFKNSSKEYEEQLRNKQQRQTKLRQSQLAKTRQRQSQLTQTRQRQFQQPTKSNKLLFNF